MLRKASPCFSEELPLLFFCILHVYYSRPTVSSLMLPGFHIPIRVKLYLPCSPLILANVPYFLLLSYQSFGYFSLLAASVLVGTLSKSPCVLQFFYLYWLSHTQTFVRSSQAHRGLMEAAGYETTIYWHFVEFLNSSSVARFNLPWYLVLCTSAIDSIREVSEGFWVHSNLIFDPFSRFEDVFRLKSWLRICRFHSHDSVRVDCLRQLATIFDSCRALVRLDQVRTYVCILHLI
jgi:hypothetical protein